MNLNEAIYEVIRTQFKKDMGEALEIVENAGYKVYKASGRFYVRNTAINKEVFLHWNSNGTSCSVYGNNRELCSFRLNEMPRVEFVGYLNKPFNLVWYEVQARMSDWRSPTWYRYSVLADAKSGVEYNEKQIERLTKQIKDFQITLNNCIADRYTRAQRLVNVRKELGLAK